MKTLLILSAFILSSCVLSGGPRKKTAHDRMVERKYKNSISAGPKSDPYKPDIKKVSDERTRLMDEEEKKRYDDNMRSKSYWK